MKPIRTLAILFAFSLITAVAAAAPPKKPNIIFILADDLGYAELGCYGQKEIKTPHLDQMAAEGIRFTDFYAGSTVCAPSRCVLMTGKHLGHAHVRGNAGGADMARQSLRDEDVTVAEMLKKAGYATALCGKWGLGDDLPGGHEGLPRRQGFDHFFGYLNQVHAHNYYPEFLWRNEEKVALRNIVQPAEKEYGGFRGGWATKKLDYSHDLVIDDALNFIRQEAKDPDHPFFLYLALTIPHANNEATRGVGNGQEVPDYGIYADKDWKDQDKGQAAMVTRMDADMGRILDLLEKLKIADNTLVMFSSDNGPHHEGGHDVDRFDPAGPFRGMKRDLYEGGVRVPMIAWWPGTVPAGKTSHHIGYFGDLMATCADLAGVKPEEGLDSISFEPTLVGDDAEQKTHKYLYWEFYERNGKQSVRAGDWKAVNNSWPKGSVELYNLKTDPGETNNVAADHPDVLKRLDGYMKEAHVDHPDWQTKGNK